MVKGDEISTAYSNIRKFSRKHDLIFRKNLAGEHSEISLQKQFRKICLKKSV